MYCAIKIWILGGGLCWRGVHLCVYTWFLRSGWFYIGGAMANFVNGTMSERELSSAKRRRRANNSDGEEEDGYYGSHISEEQYRSMLGEHIQKYKRRYKESSLSPAPAPLPMGLPIQKSKLGGSKTRKFGNEQRRGLYDVETTSEWPNDTTPQKRGDHHEPDFTPKYVLAV